MTKLVIFDFWGTLAEQGVRSHLQMVKNILRLEMDFSEFVLRFEKVFMTQEFPDLKSAFQAVIEEFELNPPEFVVEKLIGMWNKNTLLAELYPDTIECLEDLKKDYKIALIANTDGFSIPAILEKFKLEKYFDFVYLSYKEGALKTDPKSFKKILTELDLTKKDALMLGDSIESDMGGAQKAGIRSILIDRRNRREYPDKIEKLSQLREKI